jgi:hypothetical protein
MTDKLISGYAAYTSAEEINAAAQAPATPIVASIIVASAALSGAGAGISVGESIKHGC